jgi:hypothetical protein
MFVKEDFLCDSANEKVRRTRCCICYGTMDVKPYTALLPGRLYPCDLYEEGCPIGWSNVLPIQGLAASVFPASLHCAPLQQQLYCLAVPLVRRGLSAAHQPTQSFSR